MINGRVRKRQGARITARKGTGGRTESNMLSHSLRPCPNGTRNRGGIDRGAWVRSSANDGYIGNDTAYADNILSFTPGAE